MVVPYSGFPVWNEKRVVNLLWLQVVVGLQGGGLGGRVLGLDVAELGGVAGGTQHLVRVDHVGAEPVHLGVEKIKRS